MRCQSKQYIWAFSLVFVTVVVFTLSASAVPTPSGPLHPTLYVRCEDQHGWYPTIQAAVNNAHAGYTIKVCEGTYTENVGVYDNRSGGTDPLDGLWIEAEDGVKLRCKVTGGSGFDLQANHVTIEGFDISKCASAISVETNGGERFSENNLHNNTVGISLNSSSGNNSVIDNNIYDNSGDGILDFGPWGDYIFSNQVHENGNNGIDISSTSLTVLGQQACYLTTAVITDNEVTDNGSNISNIALKNGSNGIYLNNADCVHVEWNELSENYHDGLNSNGSSFGVIAANDADENSINGIEMSSSTASNILQDNRMQMQKDINFDATDHDANTWVNNHGTHCSPSTICVP